MNFKNVKSQLTRWVTFLHDYDFIFKHRSGRVHSSTDSLSRYFSRTEETQRNICMVYSEGYHKDNYQRNSNMAIGNGICSKGNNSVLTDTGYTSIFTSLVLSLMFVPCTKFMYMDVDDCLSVRFCSSW